MRDGRKVLEVEDLAVDLFTEEGPLRVVNGISFSVAAGETLALVGESGCGKSMTALSLMRLLPEDAAITAGDVKLLGTSLPDLPEEAMCRCRGHRIAMVFQEASGSLNPVQTVGKQIDEVLRLNTLLGKSERHAKVIEWLGRVGLPEPERKAAAYPFELSGGQKQRVLIAMALAGDPEVVIADEPTTALDVTLQAQILDLLKSLQKERGTALLLITHDLAVVKRFADRVALMYAGEVVETADCAAFFAGPRHPYAAGLLAAVPTQARRGAELAGIPGRVPTLTQLAAMTGCRFAPRCPNAKDACRQTAPGATMTGAHAVRCFFPGAVAADLPVAEEKTPAVAEPVLEVAHFSVVYEASQGLFRRPRLSPAVTDVTLSLSRGETLALVGESGSGKTTFGKAVMGLLDDAARVAGEVTLAGRWVRNGRLVSEADARHLRRSVQMIFQDPYASLDPRMTVGESVTEGMKALGIGESDAARRKRAEELLDLVELPRESFSKLPHEFSGGQRQRIAIARALAASPAVVICDEPTSALDVSVQAQIVNLLRAVQRETQTAYLFITHNFSVVEYFADRIAVMKTGRLVETGRTADVLSHPADPYTQKLLAAVPRL